MKTKLTAILLTVITVLSLSIFSASAHVYNEDLAASITAKYKTALELANRRTFYGKCNLATAYQLRVCGIFTDDIDFAGAGGEWYDYYQTPTVTSGGYNAVTFGGKNCLYDLVKTYGDEIYNVVYSLGTGGTSGTKHVLLIHAIIDGYVYFTDSFGTSYNQVYYPEGACTVRSISDFIADYKIMNGDAFGCIYFTKSADSYNTEEIPEGYTTGTYAITASLLRIRDGASTDDDSLGLIENGTTVTVEEIKDNWGKITWNDITGWICLDYTVQLSCDEKVRNEIISMILESDKSITYCGDTVTWTATVSDTSSKYFYAFYIYRDGTKVYNGTFSSVNTVSFVPDADGTYKATVEITDKDNNSTVITGADVYCLAEKNEIVFGDSNDDGIVTASDARNALRMSAMMENITGKNFVCADIDKDKKVTASDARRILRIACDLERDIES